MQCNNCGNDLEPGVEFCGNCGAKILNVVPATQPTAVPPVEQTPDPSIPLPPTPAESQTPVPPAQPITQVPVPPVPVPPTPPIPSAPAAAPTAAYAVARQPKNGMSIASLVLGILACVSFFIFFFSIPMGILAIIFGFIGRSKGSKGMGLAGIILGSVAIVLTVVVIGIAANYCNNNPQAESCVDSTQAKFIQPLRSPIYK